MPRLYSTFQYFNLNRKYQMESRFKQKGETIDYTPAAAVICGQVVPVGGLVGIVASDVPANNLGALNITGVYAFDKASATVFSQWQTVYWDDTNNLAVTSPTSIRLGVAVAAAANGDVSVDVLLQQPVASNRLLYSAVSASTAISNVATETAFDRAVTIPANTLTVGDVIRVRAAVIATATNSTDTLDIQLRLGTTDVAATGAIDVANNNIAFIDFDIIVRTIGASGTFVATGVTAIGAPGTATALPRLTASTALDTTADLSLNVSATWSVANAGNSCRLDVLNVSLLKA
jgi:predicted RecA/RadA family phage recombinase